MYKYTALLLIVFSCTSEPTLDLYIENAQLLDGTGSEAYDANIGIIGDEIVFISDAAYTGSSVSTIDAEGMYLAPGFIDLHAHGNPLKTPEFENFLAMGVTSIVLGQDGSSPTRDLLSWKNYIDSLGTGVNIAMFVGHGSIRRVQGDLSPAALDSMKAELRELLPYTFGLSSGLEYNPGLYASEKELEELATIVGENDLMIMSHMRNEDDTALLASIDELALQGKYARVHISHLKSVYGKGKERAEEILAHIDSLRSAGVSITGDMYPYTASYTGISILFPDWCKTEEQFEEVKATRLDELKEFLRAKIEARNGPEATLLGTDPYTGKTLAALAEEFNTTPEDFLIDEIGPQGASGAYFVMNEELQERLMQDPQIGFCSDGSPTGFHPRGHGTYARILEEFVSKRKTLSLEEAVRKMTSYPAEILGLADRGRVQEGMKADLVLFDLSDVHETATYSNPHQLAEGFTYVIVNGEIARGGGGLKRAGIYLMN